MVGKESDAGTSDCKFPNIRKTYWRSATWNCHSAPPSPQLQTLADLNSATLIDNAAPPCTPRSCEQNGPARSRLPLLPLSIASKSHEEWPIAGLDDAAGLTSPITPGRRRVKAGLDIKLDLASVHRGTVEPTEIQLRRDKFALFDKQCSRVANYHIYLGSDAVARDREILRANGITHVLNCVGFVCPEYFKEDLVYKTLWLQDSPCEDITSLLYDVFDYFEEVREQEGRVFVHCCQGVSRSASFVIAYLMWKERISFENAFKDVKAARGVANPNMGFACQLLQCQRRVHGTGMSPRSVLRMYRIAPHSPYDPLHLVPKALLNPEVECLDSRGAFVIHIPCAMLVWVGHHCDPKMAQAAEEAAGQVIRYERVEGLLKVFTEGNEDLDFWESFSNHSCQRLSKEEVREDGSLEDVEDSSRESEAPKMYSKDNVERCRPLEVGRRKVASNDADYVLYQTARAGGVIPPMPFTCMGVAATPTRIPIKDDGWSVLRRKFLSKELAALKQRFPSHGPKTSIPSPTASMGSSSPQLSDSSFASPLSCSENLSPGSPEIDSAPSPIPINSFINSSGSRPSIGSLLCSSPPMSTDSCLKKSAMSPLAQRRGSVQPTLQLPAMLDDPPPAPRGMSRKPKLPPLVMAEKCRKDSSLEVNQSRCKALGEPHEGVEKQLSSCNLAMECLESTAKNDERQLALQVGSSSAADLFHRLGTTSTSKSLPEAGRAFLYLWPGLERITMFDADDLDTRGAFILLASACCSRADSKRLRVSVWVGRQLAASKEGHAESPANDLEGLWHQIGQDFVQRMQLTMEAFITVVREGQESEEFWEAFNRG